MADTVKLSCARCNQKKVKCDKSSPACGRCQAALVKCVYLERRSRPSLRQPRELRGSSQISEHVEQKQPHRSSVQTPASTSSPHPIVVPPLAAQSSDTTSLTAQARGTETWIYTMANDVRLQAENDSQSRSTPSKTFSALPTIDDALVLLKEALNELGNLKLRPEVPADGTPPLKLTPDEAKDVIRGFCGVLETNLFLAGLDSHTGFQILMVMPDIVESPFVEVNPAAKMLYYNALYFGLGASGIQDSTLSRQIYLKCLETIPKWLASATKDIIDLIAVGFMSWTALCNFDYQTSWEFHIKACQIIKDRGIDSLDQSPPKTSQEDTEREVDRRLYWGGLQTDIIFHVFYGKPLLLPGYENVKPPALLRPGRMQPSLAHITLDVVKVRFTALTVDYLKAYESSPSHKRMTLTDDFCSQLELMISESDSDLIAKWKEKSPAIAWQLEDYVISAWVTIIGVRRMARRAANLVPIADDMTLKAARIAIPKIIQISKQGQPVELQTLPIHCMTFYPFAPFFSLHEHILATKDPALCKDDLEALESLGAIMELSCAFNPAFRPISNTLRALNMISRIVQRDQFNRIPADSSHITQQPHHSSAAPLVPSQPTTSEWRSLLPPGLTQQSVEFLQDLGSSPLENQGWEYPYSFNSQSSHLVRALESDILDRTWHENLWGTGEPSDLGLPNGWSAPP